MEIDPFKEMGISTKALVIINEFESQTNNVEHLCMLLSLMAKDEAEKRIVIETVEKNLRENCPCHPSDVSAIVSQLVRVALPTPGDSTAVISRSKSTTVVASSVKGLVKSQFSMGFEAGLKAADSLASKRLVDPDARPRTAASPAKKFTVLIADDDDHMRLIFKIPLVRKGYRVIEASNGVEAWSRIKGGGIDLVILDMRMPGRHGIEILGEMRAKKMALPVITCSAYDLEDMPEVREYPCLRYMTKPVKTDEVVEAIDELLRRTER